MALDPNILALAERFGIAIPANLTRSATIPIPSMTEVDVSKATVETREKAKPSVAVSTAAAMPPPLSKARKLKSNLSVPRPTATVPVKRTAATAKQPTGGRLLTASGHPATAEQIEINSAAERLVAIGHGAIKIVAYAGAGKTSTLDLLGRHAFRGMRGTYLAFNKDIADDARKSMPGNVTSTTIHSLACQTLGARPGEFKNLNTMLIRRIIGSAAWLSMADAGGAPSVTQQRWVAEGLRQFCMNGTDEPGESDIIHVLDHVIGVIRPTMPDEIVRKMELRRAAARSLLEAHLAPTWKTIVGDRSFWTFDSIIKMFSVDNAVVDAASSGHGFILLDEVQDLNGVMRCIADKACRNRRILVAVGDPWQQIYTWNGAENALDHFDGETLHLTQSFRFGQTLANYATNLLMSKPLGRPTLPIRGNPRQETEITIITDAVISRGDTVICRSNAGLLAAALRAAKDGLRIHIVKGLDDLVAEVRSGVALYETRMPEVRHATFKAYENWQECKAYAEDERNEALQRLIDGIENGRIQRDLDIVTRAVVSNPQNADAVFSTGHKAKGREFDSVLLWSDFPTDAKLAARYSKAVESETDREEQIKSACEEWHVKYVAATRARKKLTIYDKTAMPA